jgi:hypothetical protein
MLGRERGGLTIGRVERESMSETCLCGRTGPPDIAAYVQAAEAPSQRIRAPDGLHARSRSLGSSWLCSGYWSFCHLQSVSQISSEARRIRIVGSILRR